MKHLLIALVATLGFNSFGQDATSTHEAQFPGGQDAMQKHIASNLHCTADEQGGKVYVGFTVEADGTVSDVKVLRGIDEALDRCCLTVVMEMPKWEPATKDGKAVKSTMTLPFSFEATR